MKVVHHADEYVSYGPAPAVALGQWVMYININKMNTEDEESSSRCQTPVNLWESDTMVMYYYKI